MSFQFGPKNPRPGPKWLQVPSFRPAAVAAVAISGGEKCWNLENWRETSPRNSIEWQRQKKIATVWMVYCISQYEILRNQDYDQLIIFWMNRCWVEEFCTSKSQPFTRRLCQGYADRMLVETLCLASRAEINSFVKTHSMQQKIRKHISSIYRVCIFWCIIQNFYQISINF